MSSNGDNTRGGERKLAISVIEKSAPIMRRFGADAELVIERVRLALAEAPYLAGVCNTSNGARSMAVAVCRAVSMGLDQFGGPLATAYLVPFKDRDRGMIVQLIPSYRGLAGLAVRDGLIRNPAAGIFYLSDEKSLTMTDGAQREFHYTPDYKATRRLYGYKGDACTYQPDEENPPLFAWMSWTNPDGTRDYHWMPISDVMRVRNASKGWDITKPWKSPWGAWGEEMAKKTVIKQASKLWGLGVANKSPELMEALTRANAEDTGEVYHEDAEIIDIEAGESSPDDALASEIEGR